MDALEIDDDVYINKNLSMTGLSKPADVQRRKSSSCATVCLALLCAVLLAGNIGQIIYYEFIGHCLSTDASQGGYNTQTQENNRPHNKSTTAAQDRLQRAGESWSAERKELEARLSSVTEEKVKLQQSYDTLATERDEFKAEFKNMTIRRDQVQESYSSLKRESDQLKTSYDELQKSLQELQSKHSNLTAGTEQLQSRLNDLQREKEALQTGLTTLTANRDQIQSNCSSLKTEKEQLQRNYSVFSASKDQLQRKCNSSLWTDKEQLQNKYDALRREKVWLQLNYTSLVLGRSRLQTQLRKLTAKLKVRRCPTGWTRFDISCYFVSTVGHSWEDSRKACEAAGAHLVVIDNEEEQEYVSGLLNLGQNAWIGLTDSLSEGTWRWVDGSPVTTAFWQPGQPNSYNGNQDCGEMVHKSESGFKGQWNDYGCFAQQIWICEQ